MAKIHKQISKQEKRAKKELAAALLLLFLGVRSSSALLFAAPSLTARLQKKIAGLHVGAQELANQHTGTTKRVETVDPVLTTAAAMGVVGTVMGTTTLLVNTGKTFQDALQAALEAARPRLDRIATTETFTAFNTQLRANLAAAVGEFEWDATLDKRTCVRCASRAGKRWVRLSDVPECPAHVNCRCLIKFIPA